MPKKNEILDLSGMRFGRLTAISSIDGVRPVKWVCRCDCGAVVDVFSGNLRGLTTQSCGCLQIDRVKKSNTVHGMRESSAYRRWCGMKKRCHDPNDKDYANYGGRGITVCDEWRYSFKSFYRDMGDPPKKHQIDRIDNNSGYSKENCRWVTPVENTNNRRMTHFIMIDGVPTPLSKAAKDNGVSYTAAWRRMRHGYTGDDIVMSAAIQRRGPSGRYSGLERAR